MKKIKEKRKWGPGRNKRISGERAHGGSGNNANGINEKI